MNQEEQLVYIRNKIESTGTSLSGGAAEALLSYHRMLTAKNKVMNLTRITDFEDAVEKHYMDALSILPYIGPADGRKLLDAGSGAGIPGIPLKIAAPALDVTLMDSVGKKVAFHNEVKEALGLEQFQSVHARFENAAHDPAYREQYDIVTARAVAALPVLAEYCLPFVKVGGIFAAYKSADVEEELHASERALKILGGRVSQVVPLTIGSNSRTLIFIEKVKQSPKRYPRKAGTPSKNPL